MEKFSLWLERSHKLWKPFRGRDVGMPMTDITCSFMANLKRASSNITKVKDNISILTWCILHFNL